MPTFPGEVCDLIIDQMGISREGKSVLPLNRDLTNCAMVCRDWVPRSRMNHFESLSFAKHSSHKRLSSFVGLLSSPHATIAHHVRRIVLNFGQGKTLIPKSVFMCIGALFALQSVTLNEYTPNGHPGVEDVVTVLGSLVELTHLELSYCSLKSFNQLRAMICACRKLKRLYILGVHPSLPPLQAPSTVPLESLLCPPLQVLKLSHCVFAGQLLGWLESCVLPLPLSALWIDSATVLLCGRLTRALGSKLEHMSIHYCNSTYYRTASSDEKLDLCCNSRLRTLSFWRCGSAVLWHNGLAIIDQVSSSNFRGLNISLHGFSIDGLSSTSDTGPDGMRELTAIDTLLQRPKFADLEWFNVGLPGPGAVDSMQDFFPRTAARGLLRAMPGSEMGRLMRAEEHADEVRTG